MSDASVSVIIPCYNQAHFLDAALTSVLEQSRPVDEVIIVDDGSEEPVAGIAETVPSVRVIRQPNAGLSAARNTGLYHSRGTYLVFLDADDLLLPHAVEAGLQCFAQHPEAAFVFGKYSYIDPEGNETGLPAGKTRLTGDPYENLLRRNHIAMHGAVMYRRDAVIEAGGFDPSLRACEDYDLYLRIARVNPMGAHERIVAAYRKHGVNMSGRPFRMLRSAWRVLRAQRPHLTGNPQRYAAYRHGLRFWLQYYGRELYYTYCPGFLRRPLSIARRLLSTIRRLTPQRLFN